MVISLSCFQNNSFVSILVFYLVPILQLYQHLTSGFFMPGVCGFLKNWCFLHSYKAIKKRVVMVAVYILYIHKQNTFNVVLTFI